MTSKAMKTGGETDGPSAAPAIPPLGSGKGPEQSTSQAQVYLDALPLHPLPRTTDSPRNRSTDTHRSERVVPSLTDADNQGIYGHLTWRNLAALAADRGDQTEARRLWADVLAKCPDDRNAVAKLEQIYLTRP
jgi:hypothetical protein